MAEDQPALFDVEAAGGKIPTGRHERNTVAAIEASTLSTRPAMFAAATACIAAARALDLAERKDDAYAAGQTLRSLTDLLGRMGLLPDVGSSAEPQGGGGDAGSGLGGYGGPALVHSA